MGRTNYKALAELLGRRMVLAEDMQMRASAVFSSICKLKTLVLCRNNSCGDCPVRQWLVEEKLANKENLKRWEE